MNTREIVKSAMYKYKLKKYRETLIKMRHNLRILKRGI